MLAIHGCVSFGNREDRRRTPPGITRSTENEEKPIKAPVLEGLLASGGGGESRERNSLASVADTEPGRGGTGGHDRGDH
jgi:hypothetical protein